VPKLTRSQRRHRSNLRRIRARKLLAYQPIYDLFPECFAQPGDIRSPLAIGIYDQLVEALPELNQKFIRGAIAMYTSNLPLYRASFRYGEARIGLDGEITGTVTEKDAAHAGRLLMDAGLIIEAAAIAWSIPAELVAA
jgi:sRNA-binding protein